MKYEPIVRDFGLVDYVPVWKRMARFAATAGPDTREEIWLLSHKPVFTLGQAAKQEHLLDPGAVPVIQTDRGGQVTYHGPGQLVVYPLLDLRRRGMGIRQLVDLIEAALIEALAEAGIIRRNSPRRAGRIRGRGKNRRPWLAHQERLELSRPQSECRHGPRSVQFDQPLRLSGTRSDPGGKSGRRGNWVDGPHEDLADGGEFAPAQAVSAEAGPRCKRGGRTCLKGSEEMC